MGCQSLEGGHQSQQCQCDVDLSGTDKNTQGIVVGMFQVQYKFNLYLFDWAEVCTGLVSNLISFQLKCLRFYVLRLYIYGVIVQV